MTGLSITNWGEIGPGDPPEVESKAGDLIRATTKRSTVGTCYGCTMRFTNIGAVFSHARSSRHPIATSYRVEFIVAPAAPAGGDE